ncbi:MAG: 7-cyano-7-deazaguanine synthase, partial [Eubacterium sp.]|nr:7-cyano-7-deazaguanine synthase [Eubacterium sp.]
MKKILIALSGGVDSSVAAGIITKEYEAIGATMKLYCGKETDLKDAEAICNKIGIPYHLLDFEEDFKHSVIKDFIDTYKNGGTPNPCIVCNKVSKFGKLLEAAAE